MILGLTGSIATGKSSVAKIFKEQNIPVICADEIAHQLTQKNSPVLETIQKKFGATYIKGDGSLDREKLGQLVFSNEDKRKELNNLLHPLVKAEMLRQIEDQRATGKKLVVLDIPLLFEAGFETLCDKVLVVYAPANLALSRLMQRNKLSREEAGKRLASQMDIELKKQRAGFVIDNSGNPESTKSSVIKFIGMIT